MKLIAQHTVKRLAELANPAFFSNHPRTINEWRGVPHMLAVKTLQLRHPVIKLIEVIANYAALH